MTDEWHRGDYTISTDPARLDLAMIHGYLSQSAYWAIGRSLDVVRRSIENSLPFVLPEHRGQGSGKWLIGVIIDHPRLPNLRRWFLATKDAHGLYAIPRPMKHD